MKTLTAFLLLAGLCCTTAAAQSVPGNGAPGGPAPDIRAFLGLSGEQMEQLRGLQAALPQKLAPLAQAQGEVQRAMQQQLESASPNPAVLGDLLLRTRALGQQMEAIRREVRNQAAAILTPEQRPKLEPLRMAHTLRVAAQQALSLNLIGESERPGGGGQ